MKKTLIISLTVLGLVGLVANTALAAENGHGFSRMFERKAEMLNTTVDELEGALEGQTFAEVLEEEGIDREEWQKRVGEASRARWEERGISEEEIAERIRLREERHAECGLAGGGMMGGRFKGSGYGAGHRTN